MSLIVCPECGKEISDKCEICVHCGYPLISTKCNINGIIYDLKEELPTALLERTEDYIPAIGKIRRKTGLCVGDACDLVDMIREIKAIPSNFTPKFPPKNLENSHNNTASIVVACPYCHSTNTTKITAGDIFFETLIWGDFGSKRHKEWHCNNCNSDF